MTADDRGVIIGDKPLFLYIAAGFEQYKFSRDGRVTIIARGRNITKAVDVAVILRRDFLARENLKTDIATGSEEFENDRHVKVRVSTIEIILHK